jgi:tripartite ATP-independent transporter DctM subunit
MDPDIIAGIVGVSVLLLLMILRCPIAFALLLVGTGGLMYFMGLNPAITYIPTQIFKYLSKFTFIAVPLFLLMGYFTFHAGLTSDAYKVARDWVGHLPGGLGIATVLANAAFGAAAGSSLASCAAFSKIAVPEMARSGYSMRLATGIVASAGGLAILIPPSIIMIIYGILTETSPGKLFIAGLFPALLYVVVISIGIIPLVRFSSTWKSQEKAPPPPSLRKRLHDSYRLWTILVLALLVIGGIYTGLVDPTEAAALGAFGSMLLALALGKLNWPTFKESVFSTLHASSMIFLLLAGASVFSTFLTRSGLMSLVTTSIIELAVPLVVLLGLLVIFYVILGMFLDAISMMVLTLPLVTPVMLDKGIDFIWFGVFLTILIEVGAITPPLGLNIYVMKGILKDEISLEDMFLGAAIFVPIILVVLGLLILFPEIVTWLPQKMAS